MKHTKTIFAAWVACAVAGLVCAQLNPYDPIFRAAANATGAAGGGGGSAADSMDNFNRANAASITGSTMSDGVGIWDGVSGRTACNITDNECSSDGSDRMNCVHTEGVSGANCDYNDDQWASVKLVDVGSGGWSGVGLRITAATGAGYWCITKGLATAVAIYEQPGSVELATFNVAGVAANDVLRFEISSGTITCKTNGVLVNSYTDTTPTTGGQPAVYSNNSYGVDDFRCGNL